MPKIKIKQAVVLAGGRGARLRPITDKIPKPMVLVNKKPFLEHLLNLLKENGISEVVLLVGYKAEKIVDYFGDGSKFNIKINYSAGKLSWQTGTRIREAKKLLDQHFLLLYCDNYWPLDSKKLLDFYNKDKRLATVTVYSNKDKITKNNVLVDSKGYVVKYDKRRKDKNLNGVEIGFFIIDKDLLKIMPTYNFSFEEQIIPQLVSQKQLRGFLSDHRYYSISRLERLLLIKKFLKPQKVIFLDRDGVINRKPVKGDYVKKWKEFEFLPGSKKALQLLDKNGFKIFIITNQAGVGRNLMTIKDLIDIHKKMLKELTKAQVKVKGIYFCPHGWNEDCSCRKPKPGMLFKAAHDYHINLNKAIFVGDDKKDLQAGKAAGCKTILVDKNNNLLKIISNCVILRDSDEQNTTLPSL